MLNITLQFEKEQNWKINNYILQAIFNDATWKKEHGKKSLYNFSNIYPFVQNNNYFVWKDYHINFKTVDKSLEQKVFEYLSLHSELNFWKNNKIKIKKIIYKKNTPIFYGKIIKTITPVVLSLNKDLAQKYNIEYNVKNALYWQEKMWFNVFKDLLKKNILIKYIEILNLIKNKQIVLPEYLQAEFSKIEDWEKKILEIYLNKQDFEDYIQDIKLFSAYKFKKYKFTLYKKALIPGSLWDFKLSIEPQKKVNIVKIFKVVSLVWLGEKNKEGFWFIL